MMRRALRSVPSVICAAVLACASPQTFGPPASNGALTAPSLTISPRNAEVGIDESRTFTATVSTPTSAAVSTSAIWAVSGAAAIDSAGVFRSNTPGSYRVVGRLRSDLSVTDTATVVVRSATPPPVSATGYPNQPAGFASLDDQRFDALSESGWDYRDYSQATQNTPGSQLRIMQDASAPRSASNVLEFRYPTGFLGGGEPGKTGRAFPASQHARSMYMSLWVKFSSNWQGHNSTVNKIVYWQMTDHPSARARLLLEGRGTGSGPLEVWAITQGTPLGDQLLLGPNLVRGAQFIRGRWHRVEAIVRMNTSSSSDGEVSMWLDGVKIMEYRNVIFAGAAEVQRLTGFEVTPVWGGVTDRVANEQFMWIDHLYLSGSN